LLALSSSIEFSKWHIVFAFQIKDLKEYELFTYQNLSRTSLWLTVVTNCLFLLQSNQFFVSVFQQEAIKLILNQSAFCLIPSDQFKYHYLLNPKESDYFSPSY
jgi:hypothetical protein